MTVRGVIPVGVWVSKVLVVELIWGCCSAALHGSTVQHEHSAFLGGEPIQFYNIVVLAHAIQMEYCTTQLEAGGIRSFWCGSCHQGWIAHHVNSVRVLFMAASTQVTKTGITMLEHGGGSSKYVGH